MGDEEKSDVQIQTAEAPSVANEDKTSSGEGNSEEVKTKDFQQVENAPRTKTPFEVNFILDIPLAVNVEIGKTQMLVKNLLQLGEGSVIELEKSVGEPFEIYANEKQIARGEIVVINDHFGVRITEILSPKERVEKLR